MDNRRAPRPKPAAAQQRQTTPVKENTTENKAQNPLSKYKNALFILISVAVLALISIAFFYPDAIQGNVLRQADTMQGEAVGHECAQFQQQTGETSRWTNSLFSGMPTFQISPSYESSKLVSWITKAYGLWLPSPANLLFMMMIGFFILILACRTKWYVALLGAIAYAFSTYFIILIGAGHIWKYLTLAYIPPTIAGILLCYRGKLLLGGTLTALFAMMQLASNHVQMTYYSLFIVAFIALAMFFKAFHERKLPSWFAQTGVLIIAAALALGANSPNLYNTYKYGKETMRGGHSEIATTDTNPGNATKGGLDKDYITMWSYGKTETLSLLVPNIKGGATIKPEKGNNYMLSLDRTEKAQELLNNREIGSDELRTLRQFPQYFGDQPLTNGPVYVGALIFALFLVGCIIVKGELKWGLIGVTLIAIMLAWGHNLMWFSDLMIDHFPMYNKFRTVSSALVIAEITIPLLAMLALNQIISNTKNTKAKAIAIAIAFGITMIICLILLAFPKSVGIYTLDEQVNMIDAGVASQWPELFNAIEKIRTSLVSADATRSLTILFVGAAILLLFIIKKINGVVTATLLIILTLVDLYSVNKRYINHDSFITGIQASAPNFTQRLVDTEILRDTTMNYRVFDRQRFNEAMPSYFHKSIGGYHAAKLTRYQDIIDHQLAVGNAAVFNMLNAKYIIYSDNEAVINPYALGNAWFVDSLTFVDSPADEMAFLDDFNPATSAVADRKFSEILSTNIPLKQEGDTIFETSYAPNALTYHASSANGGLAVFSEVFFPWGWHATIDGQEVPIGRVNYILRAINIPAGSHTIKMVFDPESVRYTEITAYISIIIIYLALAVTIIAAVVRARRKNKPQSTPLGSNGTN